MVISVAADERTGVAGALLETLRKRGYAVITHGALAGSEREDWASASASAARDVRDGTATQAIVCCWTGTGASIAANKVAGVRAALCLDAATAEGARRWNDANVLAISLRSTSEAVLEEILDAWFETAASEEPDDLLGIARVSEIERREAERQDGAQLENGQPENGQKETRRPEGGRTEIGRQA